MRTMLNVFVFQMASLTHSPLPLSLSLSVFPPIHSSHFLLSPLSLCFPVPSLSPLLLLHPSLPVSLTPYLFRLSPTLSLSPTSSLSLTPSFFLLSFSASLSCDPPFFLLLFLSPSFPPHLSCFCFYLPLPLSLFVFSLSLLPARLLF